MHGKLDGLKNNEDFIDLLKEYNYSDEAIDNIVKNENFNFPRLKEKITSNPELFHALLLVQEEKMFTTYSEENKSTVMCFFDTVNKATVAHTKDFFDLLTKNGLTNTLSHFAYKGTEQIPRIVNNKELLEFLFEKHYMYFVDSKGRADELYKTFSIDNMRTRLIRASFSAKSSQRLISLIQDQPLISKLLETNNLMIYDLCIYNEVFFIKTDKEIKETAEVLDLKMNLEKIGDTLFPGITTLLKNVIRKLNEYKAKIREGNVSPLIKLAGCIVGKSLLKDKPFSTSLEEVEIAYAGATSSKSMN